MINDIQIEQSPDSDDHFIVKAEIHKDFLDQIEKLCAIHDFSYGFQNPSSFIRAAISEFYNNTCRDLRIAHVKKTF